MRAVERWTLCPLCQGQLSGGHETQLWAPCQSRQSGWVGEASLALSSQGDTGQNDTREAQ